MSTTTEQKPVPDYGEPWHEQEPPHPISVRAGVYWLNPRQFNRIVSCVNACAGMADPAKEIQAMREAIKEIYIEADACADGAPDASSHDKLCLEIATKLKPFLP